MAAFPFISTSEFRTNGEKEGQEELSPRSLSFTVNPLGFSPCVRHFLEPVPIPYTRATLLDWVVRREAKHDDYSLVSTRRCYTGNLHASRVTHWIRERDKRTAPLHWPLLAVAVFPPFTVTVPYDRGKVRAMRRVLRRQ